MWNQILLGLCVVQVAVALSPIYSALGSIPQPHHLKQNLYGVSHVAPIQNKKPLKATYVVDETSQNLGDQGDLVKNVYGGVDQKKQELIPQNSALYQVDDLNTDNVYGNVDKPQQNVYQPKKEYNPNQYEATEAPAYPAKSPPKYSGNNPSANPVKSPSKYSGNNPSANPVKNPSKYSGNNPTANQENNPSAYNPDDILYLTPDASKTIDQVSQKEDGSVYETVKKVRKVKIPENQGPYDGATYSVNDNYQPADNKPEKVYVNKDQLEQLKSEIQDMEDSADQYGNYPETVSIPIQDGYKYPQGQKLLCTVQYE